MHLTCSPPARPPPGSEHVREAVMLKKLHLTTEIRMSYTRGNGQEEPETRTLRYINRGAGRDVYGNGVPHAGHGLVVKLQETEYHNTSNKAEYDAINKWRSYLGEALPTTYWCGIARMYNVVGTFVSDLSCLAVSEAGEAIYHLYASEVTHQVLTCFTRHQTGEI